MKLPALPGPLGSLVDLVVQALPVEGRHHRRSWEGNGRAYIEVRGVDHADGERLAARVEEVLERQPGVDWARVNAVLGRVVVQFDQTRATVEDLVALVSEAEEAFGVGQAAFPFDRADFPGDVDGLRRELVALAADVAGVGLGVFSSAVQTWPLPVELASLATFVDVQPRLRGLFERVVGPGVADTTLAVVNAAAQGLAQGPLGLVVDAARRAGSALEAERRRQCWAAREPDLAGAPEQAGARAQRVQRPCPLPAGPVETYADRASAASVVAGGISWAARGSARRSASLALAALPKSAGLGREGFAAQLGRTLAQRGIVVADRGVLHRLDRVDTIVIDGTAVVTDRLGLDEMVPVAELGDDELARQFYRLFRPQVPEEAQSDDGWSLAPPDVLDLRSRRGVQARHRLEASGAALVLGLARGDELVGVVGLHAQADPALDAVVAAARRSGCTLVVAGSPDPRVAAVADRAVAGGGRLQTSIQVLQTEGHVVAAISRGDGLALAQADGGIGLTGADGRCPWGAHLFVGHELGDAALVVEAVGVAREVSRRSVSLALGGSSIAAAAALTGPVIGSGQRALLAVNVAAGLSFAAGTWSAAELARRPVTPSVDRTPWHAMPPGVVLERLATGLAGLSPEEVPRRLTAEPAQASSVPAALARAVVEELSNPLTPVLAVGAGLSAAVGSVADAAIVGSVGVLSALLGGVQRLATERAVARLLERSAVPARVRRGGEEEVVPADRLVTGDVVALRAGDVVPADCRILDGVGLEADESSLTGESSPVAKSAAAVVAPEIAERHSMLFEGTTIAAGRARAVVVAVGTSTEAGRSLATSRATPPPTGVEDRLRRLTATTAPIAVASGAAVVGAGLLRGHGLDETLGSGVSLAVAAVPEGLPFLVTAAQLAAARRLSERQALVRNPRTIEALGRVQVLCFDKTGTLTEGRIRLEVVSDGQRQWRMGELDQAGRAILAAALRASPQLRSHEALAHPTDRAVVEGGADGGVDATAGLAGWRSRHTLAFEPGRGWHAEWGESEAGGRLCVKGAPEVVLDRCVRWRRGPKLVALGSGPRRRLEACVDALAGQGYRVLAVAERDVDLQELNDADVAQLDFLGFVALADPARHAAAEAVGRLQAAGVQIVMITGDHPATARAIAAELGLLDGKRVLTGPELDALSDAELDEVLPGVSVFARVTPAHKVAIVAGFQRRGAPVAMTGDGANDAPAIRLADVGVALGPRSTAAARAAADVVVADDRLETIVEALVEGRAMWASVRSALAILLGGNLGEIGFTLAAAALSGRSPLDARQLLVVNLLTDLVPAMALAVRPPHADSVEALLAEGPESSLGAALTRDITVRAVSTAAGATAAWLVARATGSGPRARTVALAALVGTQLGQTVVAGWDSPAVVASAIVSAGALAAIIEVPGVSQFFGCTPLGPSGWAIAMGAAGAATAGSVVVPWCVAWLGGRSELTTPASAPRSEIAPSGEAGAAVRRPA